MLSDGRYVDINQMTKRREKRNENFFLSKGSKKKTCQMTMVKNLIEKVRYICLNEMVLLEQYHVDGVCMKLKPSLSY